MIVLALIVVAATGLHFSVRRASAAPASRAASAAVQQPDITPAQAQGFPNVFQTAEFDGATPGGAFGTSVAMSGPTLVVGDPQADGGEGALYVYTEAAGGWAATIAPPAVLTVPNPNVDTGSDSMLDGLGSSVAIDGGTIVAGATGGNHSMSGDEADGSAYIYTEPDGGWQTSSVAQEVALSATVAKTNDYGDGFGAAVAVSTSGSSPTVVVGAPGALNPNDTSGGDGEAYAYSTSGTLENTLTDPGAPGNPDDFGASVAVSGSAIVVGADGGGSSFNGLAYWYASPGAKAIPFSNGDTDSDDMDGFGTSVALSGSTIVVGANMVNGGDGAAYLFTAPTSASPATISPPTALTDSDPGGGDGLGVSVATDGSTVVVGAAAENGKTGAAYTFSSTGTPEAGLTAQDGVTDGDLATSVAVSADGVAAGADGQGLGADASGDGAGAAYVFDPLLSVTTSGSGSVTSGDGAIDCGTACTAGYLPDSTVQLTATNDSGSIFNGWGGACVDAMGSTCDVAMTASQSVSASFGPQGTTTQTTPSVTATTTTPTPPPAPAPTPPAPAPTVDVPVNQGAPAISGTATVGQLLSCSEGQWTGSPTSYSYQWEQNGVPIDGATGATYSVSSSNVGATLTCVVTAGNAAASATAASLGLVIPAPTATPAPTTTGTARLALSAGSVIHYGKGLAFSCSSAGHTLSGCAVTVTAGRTVVATGRARGTGKKLVVDLTLTSSGLKLALAHPTGLAVTVGASGSVTGAGKLRHAEKAMLSFSRQVLIPDRGMFAPNRAQLTSYGDAFLASVAEHVDRSERVICVGYTAAPGGSLKNDPFSLSLSRQRARAACAYLKRRHVSAIYETQGLGKADPLVPNTTPADLARNRRVEFDVTAKLHISR